MRTFALLCLSILAFTTPVTSQQPDPCRQLDDLLHTTYTFKPSRLSAAEQEAKSQAMDRVWALVKAQPQALLPCLRRAVADSTANEFFRLDGSTLLVELVPDRASKALQVDAYVHVDLDDVSLRTWVTTLAHRGAEGFEITLAGERWLRYPDAHYSLPEHGGFTLTPGLGALVLYGSMAESLATPALLKVLAQPNHPGRETALWILMSQATPEALRALTQVDPSGLSERVRQSLTALLSGPRLIPKRTGTPRVTREEFHQAFQALAVGEWEPFETLADRVEDGERDAVVVLTADDLPVVRQARRRVIAVGNQHAISRYNDLTALLMTMIWRPEVVR